MFYSTAEIAKRNQRRNCVVYEVIKQLGYPADKIEMRRGKPARCYSFETMQRIENALNKMSRKPRKTEKRSSEQDELIAEIRSLKDRVYDLEARVASLEGLPMNLPSVTKKAEKRFWGLF